MGSFKEYYDDVSTHQKDLSKNEEEVLVNSLSDLRFNLKDRIFSIDKADVLIREKAMNLYTIASITDDFNSNKQGNNNSIVKKIEGKLSPPITIQDLHDCNFRIEWLLSEILPELSIDSITDQWIKFYQLRINNIENKLIESCLKLSVKMALNNRGRLAHEDALQIANLALVEAAKKFNPNIGVRFNTYAHHKILFRMKQSLMEDPFGIVHVPRSAEVEDGTATSSAPTSASTRCTRTGGTAGQDARVHRLPRRILRAGALLG